MKKLSIGIDTGGTFTDLVLCELASGRTTYHKLPTSTGDPAQAVLDGIAEIIDLAQQPRAAVEFLVLGTTLGTNAVLERKCARTGMITTAGFDKHSVCFERYDYACKVRDGVIIDPSFLPIIYEATKQDDWADEEVWKKANPALRGETPFRSITEMRRFCKEAQEIPAMQNAFRRLYLNQWTEQDVRWISTAAWDNCGGECDPYEDRECYAAIDLSSTTDLSVLLYLFPPVEHGGRFDILVRFYVPEIGARRRSERDKVPYLQWIQQGFITATSGEVIDYDHIKMDIQTDSERFKIKQIAIDRWNATQLSTQLTGAGFDVVPFGQGFASMAGPSKEFEKMVIGRQYRHGANPVLAWCAANVAVEQDAAGNIKPSKKKSTERIDGIVALVMATGLAIVAQTTSPSAYETEGIMYLGDDD